MKPTAPSADRSGHSPDGLAAHRTPSPHAPLVQPPWPLFGVRVLIVDDDATTIRHTKATLERAGCVVSGRTEVLGTSAAIHRDPPDVVLLDVDMPGLRGDALGELLSRRGGPRAPTRVLYSSLPARELEVAAGRAGAVGWIEKRCTGDELVRALARLLGKPLEPGAPVPVQPDRVTGDVLDPEILEELRSLVSPAEPDFLRSLVALYLEDAPRTLEALSAALARGDAEGIRTTAHRLKGASRTIAAVRFAELCAVIEADARAGQLTAAARNARQLAELYPEVERALRKLCERERAKG